MKSVCFIGCLAMAMGYAQNTAFVTGCGTGNVYSFDVTNSSQPAQVVATNSGGFPYSIASSPNGHTVYYTDYFLNDVYSLPTTAPFTPVALGTGIPSPQGIALSGDGSVGYVVTEVGSGAGIYSFPVNGTSHAATMMTPTGVTIATPMSIAISNGTAYVGETAGSMSIYTFPVNSTATYDATVIQPSLPANGLAVSNDGYLYISESSSGMVFRVSTANPNYSPENVTEFIANDINGLTVSSDSKTVYVTSLANGVYAFPTDQGFPQYPYIISNIVDAFGIVIPSKCLIETGGLSGNNLRLANYLNEYAPDAITDLVCNLDPGALSSALESLSPASNAFPAFIADYGLFSASQMVSDNLSQQRNNNATTEEEPVAALDQFKDPSVLTASETDQMAKPRLELHRPPTPVGKHAVWVELLGGVGYQKSQRQTAGFSVGSGGLMTAAEYRWEKVLLGGGLSYLYNSSKQDWHRGHSTTNQGMAAIYSEFTLPNFYTNGSLWGGYYHVDKTRHISTPRRKGTATSHSHGWQFMPHFEIGGQVKRGYFTLEPFASADWSNNWKRGYSEHGAPGLNMKHRHRHSSMLRTESGLRFYEKILYSWGALTFIEKLSYVHRQPFGTGNEVASLVGSPGSFKTSTLDVAQNLGVGEFEIIYNPNQDRLPKCTLGYQGEFGSISQAHQVFLTIKMLF